MVRPPGHPAIEERANMMFPALIGIGLLAGTYGSLVGAGGGFILVPLLMFLFPNDPLSVMVATSLMVVLFASLSATTGYARLRRIDYKLGLLLACASVPGALLGAYILPNIPRSGFQVFMGALLVLVALFSLAKTLRPTEKAHAATMTGRYWTLEDRYGKNYSYPVRRVLGGFLSFCTGTLSSMMGIGGGIIQVPLFIHTLRIPVQVAVATSQFVVTITVLAGITGHLLAGSFDMDGWKVAGLTIGVIAGGQLGPLLSNRFSPGQLALLLSLGLVGAGARLMTGAIS